MEVVNVYETFRLKKRLEKRVFYFRENTPRGCYGEYFMLNKRYGVKVYASAAEIRCTEQLKRSPEWRVATNAMKVMNKARKRGINAPRALFVTVIKYEDHYRVGLCMTHITGEHNDIGWQRNVRLANRLKKARIEHNDVGPHNWKVQKNGRIVLIDWDNTSLRKRK